MTVNYLRDYPQSLQPCKNKMCQSCGLYINQEPVFGNPKKSDIFWVGLSAVLFSANDARLPLSPQTRTGALIEAIEQPFSCAISFYKTNLVKCVPLKNEKIRYPAEHEMQKCFPNLQVEISDLQPSVVFLLGKQVASFVLKQHGYNDVTFDDQFHYRTFQVGDITYIPVHHPSFMLVYRRKNLKSYIENIQALFSDLLEIA
jgi:uracil-DNA glycosylase family 4